MTRFETSQFAWVIFAVFLAVLLGTEASYLLPEESLPRALAGGCWLFCAVLILGSAFILGISPFFSRGFWSSPDVGWYLTAFIVPVALTLFDVNGYGFTQINGEAAQQLASGLGLISGRRDMGIFSIGFAGYPARQYLLAAFPSLAFGRSLVALRLGYGGFYLLGYAAFLSGAWRYLDAKRADRPMLLASFSGSLVALGSYPLLYARVFEQTTVPLAAMFLFLAGILLFVGRPGPLTCLGFIWTLGFMPYAYTPSLSAWVLGMATLLYLARTGARSRRIPLLAGLIYGAAAFAVSSLVEIHANLFPARLSAGGYFPGNGGGFSSGAASAWITRYLNGLHATIGIDESLIPAPLALGMLFILVHSLRRRDIRVVCICLWAAGTIVLSLTLKGYWQRVPEFDIQRAMVVLPPLSLALVLYAAANTDAFFFARRETALRGFMVSGILFMLLNSAYLPLIRRVPRAYIPFQVTDKEEATMLVVRNADPHPRTIYLAPPLYFRLEETLAYFSPATRVVRGIPPSGEHLPGNYVVRYIGLEPYVSEDPYAEYAEHPVRYTQPGPHLGIAPE